MVRIPLCFWAFKTKKRRNNGRSKKNRGHVKFIRCYNCGRCVPKDKAKGKLILKPMADASSLKDLVEASAYEGYIS